MENKKSFVLYADLKHVLIKLPDETAGKLFKLILSYVNDENPKIDDLILDVVFEPIKQQLKRDLVKYESKREQWSNAGKKSAEKRAFKKDDERLTDSTNVENRSTDSTVNVNVSVNDNVILLKKETKFNFYNAMISHGFENDLVTEWLLVRKSKRAVNTQTAFNGFISEIKRTNIGDVNEILKICITNSWAGYKSEWLNNFNNKNQTNGKFTNTQDSREQAIREFGK